MQRFVTTLLLAGYGFVLAYLTLSPQSAHQLPAASRIQLHPLRTIADFLERGGWPMVVNVPGNLAAFVPLGLLWPVLRQGKTTARRVGLLSAGVSLVIEVLQFGSGRRIADIDDVLLNALGGLLGYGVYRALGGGWRLAVAARAGRGPAILTRGRVRNSYRSNPRNGTPCP